MLTFRPPMRRLHSPPPLRAPPFLTGNICSISPVYSPVIRSVFHRRSVAIDSRWTVLNIYSDVQRVVVLWSDASNCCPSSKFSCIIIFMDLPVVNKPCNKEWPYIYNTCCLGWCTAQCLQCHTYGKKHRVLFIAARMENKIDNETSHSIEDC